MTTKRYKYKKPYKAKKKKSIFSNRFFWLALLFLAVLGTLFYLFIFSSFFQIKKIEISGNQKITKEEIRDIVKAQINKKILFLIPRNFFFVDLKEIDRLILERFIQIGKANLKRELPDILIVNIEERVPVGAWCRPYDFSENIELPEGEAEEIIIRESDCFNLDKEGIIFEKSRENEGLVIKSEDPAYRRGEKEIALGEKVIEKDYLEIILKIEKELKENLNLSAGRQGIDIKEFFIPEQEEKLIVRIRSGWEIYFNPRNDISNQLFNLRLVLKEKISPEEREKLEYIDLRFGNRVFYRKINE